MEKIKNIRNMDDTRIVCVYDINNATYKEIIDDNYKIKKDVDFFQWICQSQEDVTSKDRFHYFYTRL